MGSIISPPVFVLLFSPCFYGTSDSWEWLCEISNGRHSEAVELNEAQTNWAYWNGYLPTKEKRGIEYG